MSSKKINPHEYIPKPCKEDWHAMSGDDKRRHCEKCDTHVVDLTGMTAGEISDLKKKNGGKLCGAFRLSKPLALGTGIATLALASCGNKREIVLPGIVCLPPVDKNPVEKKSESATPSKPGKNPTGKGVDKPEIDNRSPLILGDICEPPEPPPSAGSGSATRSKNLARG